MCIDGCKYVFKLKRVHRRGRFTDAIYPSPHNTPLQYKVEVLLGQGIHRHYRHHYYIPSLELSSPSPLVSSSCLSCVFFVPAKKSPRAMKIKKRKDWPRKLCKDNTKLKETI